MANTGSTVMLISGRCSRLFREKLNFTGKNSKIAFFCHPLGDLGVTYIVHLWLVGKRVVDFQHFALPFTYIKATQNAKILVLAHRLGDLGVTQRVHLWLAIDYPSMERENGEIGGMM